MGGGYGSLSFNLERRSFLVLTIFIKKARQQLWVNNLTLMIACWPNMFKKKNLMLSNHCFLVLQAWGSTRNLLSSSGAPASIFVEGSPLSSPTSSTKTPTSVQMLQSAKPATLTSAASPPPKEPNSFPPPPCQPWPMNSETTDAVPNPRP